MFRDRYWVFLVQEHLSNRNQVQNMDKTTVLPTVVSHREIVISATGLPGFTSPSLRFWVIQRLNSDLIRMAAPDVLQKSSFSPQIALKTSKLGKMPIETTLILYHLLFWSQVCRSIEISETTGTIELKIEIYQFEYLKMENKNKNHDSDFLVLCNPGFGHSISEISLWNSAKVIWSNPDRCQGLQNEFWIFILHFHGLVSIDFRANFQCFCPSARSRCSPRWTFWSQIVSSRDDRFEGSLVPIAIPTMAYGTTNSM